MDLTGRALFGMAFRAVVSTILLYVLWGVVMGGGVGIIVLAPSEDVAMFMLSRAAGIALAAFGLAMALLTLIAVSIKIAVGESTRRAARRMDAETLSAQLRITNLNKRRDAPPASGRPGSFEEAARRRDAAKTAGTVRPSRRADPPISERPGTFEEAMRRRDAAQADRNETQTSP